MLRKSLRSRILEQAADPGKALYEEYGIMENPFPSAGQISGHPRLETASRERIDAEIGQFYQDRDHKSHVMVVTASQGIGKTNLLNAYEKDLREVPGSLGFFIIRYIADPEASFDTLIRTIFNTLGEDHLVQLSNYLAEEADAEVDLILADLGDDMKRMMKSLREAAQDDQADLGGVAKHAQEWLLGLRVLNVHRRAIDVRFRLDTVESKTRALRDLVICSSRTGKLAGIILLLDELEKQGSLLSNTMVLRYLSALRAIIDALPRNLFLMAAITPDALRRYREMLPALRGRLANEVQLEPLQNSEEAIELYGFYLSKARDLAKQDKQASSWQSGDNDIISENTIQTIFQRLLEESTIEGVRQRDFLNNLHRLAQKAMDRIKA